MTTPPNPSWPPDPQQATPTSGASDAIKPSAPPAPPYHPGAYGYPANPMQGSTNGFAIASLVLGIVGILLVLPSILALIFGYIARRQIRERGQSGAGMAVAGIVLGWVVVGFFVVLLVIGFIAGALGAVSGTG